MQLYNCSKKRLRTFY